MFIVRPRQYVTLAVGAVVLLLSACGGGNAGTDTPAVTSTETSVYHVPYTLGSVGQDVSSLAAVSHDVVGQTTSPNVAIDQAVQHSLSQFRIPGAAVAVLQDGKLVYAKAYGYGNLETRSELKPEQRFTIGSLTKQFTASAIMLLVEDGKISLDEKASHYLGPVPTSWADITIRQLLTHTSGLAREAPDSFTYYQLDTFGSKSEDEKLAILASFPLASKPGQGFLYSNLGYNALGFVIAKVSGKSYFDFLQQRVFTPLGMQSVRQIKAGNSTDNAVIGYTPNGSLLYSFTLTDGALNGVSLASTGIEMNVLDMAKWEAALNSQQILKKSSLDQMWSAQVASDVAQRAYGFGWFVQTVNGHVMLSHNGTVGSFTTDYVRYPEVHFSVIVFTNKADNQNSLDIATNITHILQPAL